MAYIGLSPVVGEFRKLDDISGQFNDSNTVFNLTVAGSAVSAGSAQNLIISVDGIIQEPQASFTVGGSTLSFTEAPNTASTFFGILLGSVAQVGVVSDDTVSSVKLQANSVTEPKIATNAVTTAKIQNAAITNDKIADNAVTEVKIAADAVTTSKVSANIVLRGTTTFLGASLEKANVISSNVFSNVSIDNQTNSILFFTQNSTTNANVTVNFINMDYIPVGNVASFVVIITNNTNTQAKITGAQINSVGGNVVRFLGGVPTSGEANLDVYSFSVIKTAASGYTVLASKNNFD